ncbi:MAG: hypothetical protein A2406_04575 [Candidatus Komeilibacteria bacterium RIFOXYC1_FULL_37_11]|uniref:Uncharacterized protein n=1 Tax=Candidatus Komeilibacteria bacterium RIFOXYC1_FULL_37_11 TaxID=1798555 RepID=A0A1G2C2Q8_9BACT|nr:MAG: hypothetical protein A2406_04575 [Candidatus Komeilibacteria bacterium RIFOXYC1_FULL_37_11]OGY95389.1 MAG: hypothetical protein A2611_01675 [Candidatus Komeilibacteria bacterium RIFOXYD1_FULL_37_29]
MGKDLIRELDNLLGSQLEPVFKRLPDYQPAVLNFLQKNKELFDQKIKQLKNEYGEGDYKLLLDKKLLVIEDKLASYFKGQSIYNLEEQQEILNFIFSRCPKNLKCGYFLKEETARDILTKNRPSTLLDFYKCQTTQELFKKISAIEIITISRYTEFPIWQENYKKILSVLDKNDFEKRAIAYSFLDYHKYKSILRNSNQPDKPWRLSHNKVTGAIICFSINDREEFKTPFLEYLAVFIHYYFETAYAGQYYQAIAYHQANLGQAVLDSFTNHNRKFDFFGPNVYSETVYWQEAINLLNQEFDIPELKFFKDTVYCGAFSGVELISLNLVDKIWDANFSGRPFLYHFQEAAWKEIFQKIVKMSDREFDREIMKNLNMRDLDFTDYVIKKSFNK